MSLKNLSRRLERLEDRLLPDTSEPTVLTILFVTSGDGRVVEERHITLPAVKNPRGRRGRQRST
jgi:hypothetical protein